ADSAGDALSISALQTLGDMRAKNVLRHWLEALTLPLPPAHKLEQILHEVLPARADRNPCVTWPGAELRRYHDRLYGLPPLPKPCTGEFRLCPGEFLELVPGLGKLRLVPVPGEGLRVAACPAEGLRVSFRAGGEVCQPAGRNHRRPLKKWLQEFEVVPWMRERLPLMYIGDQLAAVADLFVCAPFAAGATEPGLRVEWQSHPALH
ncbi:MAG: tRNA lysidine(34) synthetase TilS, partial [Gammaproteobacteria bacterium]